uniref:Venom nucleosidase 1 n=1 Tax=Ectomocoris sp. TaxID=3104572 RepID=A0AB38ZE51_9HEMI
MARLILVLYCFTLSFILQELNANAIETKRKIIVDADPGSDDAVAILLLLSNPKFSNIKAITTVNGNTNIGNSTRNAIRILEVANRLDIPIYRGAEKGLIYSASSDNFFGVDGFGESKFNTPLPSKEIKNDIPAAMVIVNEVKAHPNEVIILAIGPLTNLAMAIFLYPTLLQEVRQVIILGGSYQGVGISQPGSEFNFYCDPEAVQVVLSNSPVDKPVVILPVETINEIQLPLSWRKREMGKIPTSTIKFLNKVENYTMKGPHWISYDAVAAAILVEPAVIKKSLMVSIETLACPEKARGVILIDYNSKKPNVRLITHLDQQLLKKALLENFSKSV